MKNIALFLCTIVLVLCFASCGMKECECYTSNVITENGVVLERSLGVDTVSNFTRGECEDFNRDEILKMDSVTEVHHVISCMEK
jgi:hypothetical protein